MGTDLSGWVEVRPYPDSKYKAERETWYGIVNATNVVSRNLDMFGCLFGVTNYAGFTPIVELRGLPDDASEEVQDDFLLWEETFAETWITWQEIAAVDWEQQAEAVDGRPHCYKKQEDGSLVYEGKSLPSSVDTVSGLPLGQEGTTWERDGLVYRLEKLSRRDALDDCWRLLFDLMARIAEKYGPEHTRLVVWFDD